MDKTADGLRSRLFDALDRVINKEISGKEVENICYISEQIIKTALVELETFQEANKEKENIRQHELRIIRERQDAIELITETVKEAGYVEQEKEA